MATYTNGIIISGAASGGQLLGTAPAQYAITTYVVTSTGTATNYPPFVTVHYGPGQTISNTFGPVPQPGGNVTYSLDFGVVFSNAQ